MKTINLIIVFAFISLSSMAQQYEYDALNRITKVTYPSGQKVHYAYDKLGNRKQLSKEKITAIEPVINKVENKITIYPNPVSTYINVNLSDNVLVTRMEIVDMQGRELWHSEDPLQTGITTIPVNLLSGVYFLSMYNGNERIRIEKIIVK